MGRPKPREDFSMLQTIRIRGLGPHEDTALTLDTMGATEITGRSEAGKSTIIDAVAFALWGCDRTGKPIDLRAMRDTAEEIRVDLELANGATVCRKLRRSKDGGRGKTTRILREREYRTEKDWTAALAAIGDNVPALRQILVPFAWRPLVEGPGNGRGFRDVLASLLPRARMADVVRELLDGAGYEWTRGDPIHARDAEEIRRDENRKRDTAAGDVQRLEQLVAVARSEQSDPVALEVPRDIVARANAWRAYQEEQERHTAREERAAMTSEAAEGWAARLAELGERPSTEDPHDAIKAADAALHAARWKRKALNDKSDAAERALTDAVDQKARAKEPRHPGQSFADRVNDAKKHYARQVAIAADGDTCPTCSRDGWGDAPKADTERALEAIKEAESERADEVDSIEADRAVATVAAIDGLDKANAEAKRLSVELAAAYTAQQQAEDAHAAARATNAPALQWDIARRALGEQPHAPPPEAKPEPPTSTRPEEAEEAEARTSLRQAERAAGAAVQRSEDLDRLSDTLAESTGTFERLSAECERLEALVSAIRRAPSVAARRQLSVLGDLGPVAIELREDGGVDIVIDGRPFHLASTGRLVVADAWLRDGLRRARGLAYFPMFIDCTQDVAGQEPHLPPPCIALRTTAGDLGVSDV